MVIYERAGYQLQGVSRTSPTPFTDPGWHLTIVGMQGITLLVGTMRALAQSKYSLSLDEGWLS